MNNQVAVISNGSVGVQFSDDQVSVIKNQIAVGATDLELKSFIWQCERTGLDPFARQIYFIKSNGKVQIQTSIDGFRLIAERSGSYEGQTPAQWCGTDGVWKDIWLAKEFPIAARVGVYKKGFREPLYAVAHWNEYFAQPGFMHKKMPSLMIAKVAESLALRKAFPNEMSGLYTQEEMNQGAKVYPDQPTDEECGAGFSGDGTYRLPYGAHKSRTIPKIAELIGHAKLADAITRHEEKLAKGEVYAGATKEQMQTFINEAADYLVKFENGATENE